MLYFDSVPYLVSYCGSVCYVLCHIVVVFAMSCLQCNIVQPPYRLVLMCVMSCVILWYCVPYLVLYCCSVCHILCHIVVVFAMSCLQCNIVQTPCRLVTVSVEVCHCSDPSLPSLHTL